MEVYMAGSLRNCIDRVCQHQYHVAMFFRHFACKAHHPEVAKMLVSSMPAPKESNVFSSQDRDDLSSSRNMGVGRLLADLNHKFELAYSLVAASHISK